MRLYARRLHPFLLVAALAAFTLVAGCADGIDPEPAENTSSAEIGGGWIPPSQHDCTTTTPECDSVCANQDLWWNGRCQNTSNACVCVIETSPPHPGGGGNGGQLCSWHYVWTSAHGWDISFDGCFSF